MSFSFSRNASDDDHNLAESDGVAELPACALSPGIGLHSRTACWWLCGMPGVFAEHSTADLIMSISNDGLASWPNAT